MAIVPAEVEGPSDANLIASVRSGEVDAYGSLYARHVAAAHNLARQLARSPAEADDLVSEAFAKVLDIMRSGGGPDSAFRAYLLTAMRHVAYDRTRRDRRLELTEDIEAAGANPERISEPFRDTAVAGLERSLAAQAFARLPERWQAVLWHTEIEGQAPAQVAPLLGMTANGVSALAYRAREGLRQAYLQVYLSRPETRSERCRAAVDKLGAWTRRGLSRRETAQVEAHLDECQRCRALAAELADVNGALRSLVAPLVLGGAAAAYLAAAKTTAVGVATVTAAGTSATTAGVAAGAGAGASGGGSGGAAGAGASIPRQLLGVGGSVAALAAALVVALTASTSQQVPAAEAPPPAAQTTPSVTPAAGAPASPAAPSPSTPSPTTPTTPPAQPIAAPLPPVPAAAADGVGLSASQSAARPVPWLRWGWPWGRPPVIDVTATNTGATTKPITITISPAATLLSSACTGGGSTCTSAAAIAPGRGVSVQVIVRNPSPHGAVTVTAQLGDASQSTTVTLDLPPWTVPVPAPVTTRPDPTPPHTTPPQPTPPHGTAPHPTPPSGTPPRITPPGHSTSNQPTTDPSTPYTPGTHRHPTGTSGRETTPEVTTQTDTTGNDSTPNDVTTSTGDGSTTERQETPTEQGGTIR